MRAITALATKDLRLLVRDRMALFFTLVFPLLYAVFFGTIFSGAGGGDGGPSEVALLVVDEDGTESSAAFARALDASDKLRTIASPSRAEAENEIRTGRRPAMIVLPKGFGAGVDTPFSGNPPKIELAVDPARQAERMMIEGLILQTSFERMSAMFTDPATMQSSLDNARQTINEGDMPAPMRAQLFGVFDALQGFYQAGAADGSDDFAANAQQAMMPVEIVPAEIQRNRRPGPQNSFEISFPQAIAWAVIGAASGFGISFVSERQRGTLVRLTAAPLGAMHVLLGKALACFATVVLVVSALLAVGAAAFGVRPDSILFLGAAIVAVALCFVGIMMVLATLAKSEAAAGGVGWAVMLVFAMLGGGMVPVFLMPGWMQDVGSVSPVKWAIIALEGAIWRGFSAGEMLLPLVVLVGIGVAGFALGAALLARSSVR